MIPLVLVCSGLLVGAAPVAPEVLQAYEAARVQTGRNAEAHVKLALWCEAHGLTAERAKHLALAVLTDPKNATARGLMGLVAYAGGWETPETVSEKVKTDEHLAAKLAEYNARRAALEDRLGAHGPRKQRISRAEAAKAHIALGMWCEQNGLKPEATAHFTSAVVINPYHDATWKHLGYVKHNGRWMSREQIAAAQQEAEAQRTADRQWEPFFKKCRAWLADKTRSAEAETLLATVTEPRAVPMLVRVFALGTQSDQQVMADVLGRIDTPEATRLLAELAVMSPFNPVRNSALQMLLPREKRDYAGMLVELIRAPMRYRAQPVQGPGSPGALLVETPRFRMLRTYDAPVVATLSGARTGFVGYDANGLPAVAYGAEVSRIANEGPGARLVDIAKVEARGMELLAEAQFKAATSQQRLMADVMAIETSNAEAAVLNQRISSVLKAAAAAPDLQDDENAWNAWWYDQIGYQYQAPQQIQVAVNASPQLPPPTIVSCFAAGTLVRTLEGSRPIDLLQVGEQVLTQDATTGALSYQPILVVHHNAPGRTLRISLDNGETLVASIYHRFWRAGQGWALARELKAGDILRTLRGRSQVIDVSEGLIEPLFNLDVAQTRTFFVGEHAALVHDNTLPDPHLTPFDAAPELAALPGRK